MPENFTMASERLDELAQRGVSWSGYERNCAFLNLRQGSFANISSAAGFDFLDDGRAVGVVDWDQDGDLDIWLANRTSPRLRILRNDIPSKNHFLTVRLRGVSCNRDAIGARVVLTVRNAEIEEPSSETTSVVQHQPSTFVRTLRAGEGFLAQSSKWLHFGLGSSQHVVKLVVHWPGGNTEEFTNLSADRRYRIIQGSGRAELRNPPTRELKLAASKTEAIKPTDRVNVLLCSRVPLPEMAYRTLTGDTQSLANHHGKPLLVNLWASWCQPCLHELNSLKNNSQRLSNAGVEVLALSVDDLSSDKNSDMETAQALLQQMKLPFRTGMATSELVDKLQMVHDHLFLPNQPLPVPTSVLLDASGELAAVYKGPVTVDRIVADVNKLPLERFRLTGQALPFQGTWHEPPNMFWHLGFCLQLADGGYLDDAIKYATEHRLRMTDDPYLPRLFTRLGNNLMNRGDLDDAILQYRKLLNTSPDNASSNYNLGLALIKKNKLEQATVYLRKAIEVHPQHAKAHNNLGNILASQKKTNQALQHYRQALRANPKFADAHLNIAPILIGTGNVIQALEHLRAALNIQPENDVANYQLANALVSQGKREEAMQHYQRTIKANPEFAEAHNNLGVVLRLQGLHEQALKHAREAVRLRPQYAEAHQNLAMALMDRKQFVPAVKHFRTAVELNPSSDNSRLNLGIAFALNGQLEDAVSQLKQATQLNPENAQAHFRLGSVLASQGKFELALKQYDRTIDLKPNWVPVIRSTAWILATHPDAQQRDPERALMLAEQAASLSDHKNSIVLDTLAAAYAATGQFERAVLSAKNAIHIDSTRPASLITKQMRRRLKLYERKQPYINK